MEKTGCLFCGGRAGAGEHVLPSSLGGLVIDRTLYCHAHEGQLADLVVQLAHQMEPFSALLGVRSDRKKKLRAATGKEHGTNHDVSISVAEVTYARPRIVSRQEREGETHVLIHARSEEEAIREVRRMLNPGEEIRVVHAGEPVRFYPGDITYQRGLGGDSMLAAVAYIALSFLSREYPTHRMDRALDDFKRFPLFAARQLLLPVNERVPHHGGYPIWWDFDESAKLPDPAFSFAHRFVIGYDGSDGLLYGRAMFFSRLSLSFHFGYTEKGRLSSAKVIDVDPLAAQRENSMKVCDLDSAATRPDRPVARQSAVARSRNELLMQEAVDSLIAEIQGYRLQKDARKARRLMSRAAKAGPSEAMTQAREICSDAHQRLLNLARKLPIDAGNDVVRATWLRELIRPIERAPEESTGLTVAGQEALAAMAEALAEQMVEDSVAGTLDLTRMENLLGGTAGKAVLERALVDFSIREGGRSHDGST